MARTVLFLGILTAAAVVPIFVNKAKTTGPAADSSGQPSDTKFRLRSLIGLDRPEAEPKIEGGEQDAKTWFTSESRVTQNPRSRPDPQLLALLKPPTKPVEFGPAITPIPEALRFDITPSYVAQRWPRVSNQLADIDWYGMRVPLVTGTQMQDLHGSVSYFFDRNHRLQRIKVHGFTADSEPLVEFLTSTYRLREYAASDGRIYLAYYQNQPISFLQVRGAGVLSSENRHTQQEVDVEINAPSNGAILSVDSLRIIKEQREFSRAQ